MRLSTRAGVAAALMCLAATSVYAQGPDVAEGPNKAADVSRPAAQPIAQLRIIAPAAPGGGWDQTARVMQSVLQRAGIVRTPVVENIPGAAGTIGLARFIGAERGNGDAIMVSGLIMLGGIVTHLSPVTLDDVTPMARLTGEYEVIAVPAASPYRTFADLVTAFKGRPESISWGGGSAGGSDQILAGLIADAVGVQPRRVNYIAFSGGGESLSAIIGGQGSAGINGLAEFAPHIEAGTIRALAISSAERLPGLDIATLREQGVDVEFENWRSIVAPPGLSREDRGRLDATIAAMVRSAEWQEALQRYRWLDRYLAGPEFAAFGDAEEVRVRDTLRALGTGDVEAASLADAGPYPLFVLAGVFVFGIAAVTNIRRTGERRAEARFPRIKSIGLIVIGAILNLALAERAGFVIASAALFWFVARAFDEHHPRRDALFAVGISVFAYLLFARLLQLSLPAGVLAGWL
jgi:putative tricarboxylic transport membrane protein